jgi:hypothetical protein
MSQSHAGRASGLVVLQPQSDRCAWLGRARAVQGRPLVHVAVHALHGHIPASIHDHFTTISRPFAAIYNHSAFTAPHGPVRYALPVGWHPPASLCAARRSACAQHSILEQKCKENTGMAPFAAAGGTACEERGTVRASTQC